MKSDREKELTKVEGCVNEAQSDSSSEESDDGSDSDSKENISKDSDENDQFDDVGVGQKRPLIS